MNVINRLPPNSSQILEAAGIDPSYLDEFYESGLDGMPPPGAQDFMTAIQQLSIILQAPSDITREAWNDAAQRRLAMVAELERQFPNYQYVVDEYYQRLGEEGPEGAQAVMDANPWLANYFDTKDALIAADPLLTAYYGSFDQLERYMWDNRYTEAKTTLGASELSAQYGSLMETNPDAARALLDANKELLTGYWDAKNEAQLEINNARWPRWAIR